MDQIHAPVNWIDTLSIDLKSAVQTRGYVSVTVLTLYWEAGDEGFKREAQAVQSAFKDDFRFTVTEVPIQSNHSYFQVMGSTMAVTETWMTTGMAARKVELYGQPQAARDRKHGKGKFEVMAAAAMGVKTRGAGSRSFTSILLRELKLAVQQHGSVNMKDLHGHLCGRKQDLFATPVHISLKPRHSLLLLEPLQRDSSIAEVDVEGANKSFLHLLVEVKEVMTVESAGSINEWLREGIPHFVSSLDVFQKTEHIHRAVQDLHQGQKKFAKQIGVASKDEIARAWATVLALVEKYHQSSLNSPTAGLEDEGAKKRQAIKFLCQLDSRGSGIVDVLEKSILETSAPEGEDILKETAEDETIRALGIDSQLHIRRMIMLSDSRTVPLDPADTEGEILHPCIAGTLIIQEVKAYGSYVNPSDLPALHYRLSLLAKLLGTPKSRDFRSLKCSYGKQKGTIDRR
ncbi:hypothetical protein Daus18300_002414 [Diaporthe australafricana]|uniref:Uncharacterized protein n=1 Tax=Diaporthe australafricana TaxID=127596 RepID=A0ABR3XN69_9PEZI